MASDALSPVVRSLAQSLTRIFDPHTRSWRWPTSRSGCSRRLESPGWRARLGSGAPGIVCTLALAVWLVGEHAYAAPEAYGGALSPALQRIAETSGP
jgi:hypothetical protein